MGDTLFYFLPFFVWHTAAMSWISAGRLMPILSDIAQLIAAPTIIKAVFVGLFGVRDQKFAVTAKGGDRSRRLVEWGLLKLYAGMLIVTLAGVAFYFRPGNLRIDAYGGLALGWCWYNIVILTLACFVCVERPRYRMAERYATSEIGLGRERRQAQGAPAGKYLDQRRAVSRRVDVAAWRHDRDRDRRNLDPGEARAYRP